MPEISDTELLMDLIENDANKAPGLKAVAAYDPSTGTVFQQHVMNCEPSHTVGPEDDTKISCPGCGQLCDMAVCWCGGEREDHFAGCYRDHGFVPMGCNCYRGTSFDQAYWPVRLPEPEPVVEEPECEWDIL